MKITEMKERLQGELPGFRYEHTLGVEYTSACLALRYGADMEKARIAGLLHDCAKCIPTEQKLSDCEAYGLPVSEWERKNPELLHAKLGAVLARRDYGIEDEEILSAITWHTTGKPAMSLLDKIVFIADYMEPNRANKAPNLPEVRVLAFEDLDRCLLRILTDTVDYLAEKGGVTDPMTRETCEYYQEELKNG